MGGKSMKDVGGAGFAGRAPSFLGRERAAVNVDVGPERRSPRYHESCLLLRVLKKAARRYWNRGVCGCACPSSKISKTTQNLNLRILVETDANTGRCCL